MKHARDPKKGERQGIRLRASTIGLLRKAYKEKYGVPAFDYSDIWEAWAIIRAAEKEKSPVILMTLPPICERLGVRASAGMVKELCESARVPVALHIDHAPDCDLCEQAIVYGYDSVMIDRSKESLPVNIAETAKVTTFAHRYGGSVEAEIGHIKGKNIETEYVEGERYLADVAEAAELVRSTDVDFLAVGIGSAHGFYMEKPYLHLDRLEELDYALRIPLVLHGGSGIPREMVRDAIRLGIAKINVGTDILTAWSNEAGRIMAEYGKNTTTFQYVDQAAACVEEKVRYWIHVCMSAGRA